MFNNNINKPAITVFLPLTSAKTSFCQWQKLVFAGKNYFCRVVFFRGKTGFYRSLAKTCQPWLKRYLIMFGCNLNVQRLVNVVRVPSKPIT